MPTEPEVVADIPCRVGEGPLWHPRERRLYWLDIPASRIYAYDPDSGGVEEFDTAAPVGGFTLHADGRLLLFMAEGAIKLWRRGETETVLPELPEERGNRFNDVIADPDGRVFCGVMSTPARKGRLYRLDPDGSLRVVLARTGTANGMGFSPDLRRMYFCDSREKRMYVFDYERATGELRNRRVLVSPGPGAGKTDGMTVDAQGCLWSARWDGWRLVRHAPDGAVLLTIAFPARNVSSVTFGGDDYEDLYVTTAGGHDRATNGPLAGALFRLRVPGVRGKPEFCSRGHTAASNGDLAQPERDPEG